MNLINTVIISNNYYSSLSHFNLDDLTTVNSIVRGCAGQQESYCSADSDQVNCGIFCMGHVCNNKPFMDIPKFGDEDKDKDNGQPALIPSSMMYALSVIPFFLLDDRSSIMSAMF